MSVSLLNRIFVAAAVIGAVSLVGTSGPANAQQDPKQQEEKKPQDPKKPQQQQAKPEQHPQAKPEQQQAKPEQHPQAKPEQQQAKPQAAQQRLPHQEQQQRIRQQQQGLVQYSAQLDQQQRAAPQYAAQLQQQQRTAQYGFQEQYIANMRVQQQRVQHERNHNYGNDPYFYTAPIYRYSWGGHFYETNEYGANVLRQAVNFGYDQGFRAGRADRQDHWAFSYQTSYAYQDGNYGYDGFYVQRGDYNYYFREGFRRGYDDGYYSRYQYGVYVTGRYNVLGGVLSVVLGLQPLR